MATHRGIWENFVKNAAIANMLIFRHIEYVKKKTNIPWNNEKRVVYVQEEISKKIVPDSRYSRNSSVYTDCPCTLAVISAVSKMYKYLPARPARTYKTLL